MTRTALLGILIPIATTIGCSNSNSQIHDIDREQQQWSFTQPQYIHPLIIKELLPWLSDTGEQIAAINLGDSQTSNRFHGDYAVHTRPNGETWVEWHSNNNGNWFAYRYIATTPSGTRILQCADCGGGSGVFQNLILLTFEVDNAIIERPHQTSEDTFEFRYEKRQRTLLKTLGHITLGDRYTGNIQYEDGYLTIGPDERWKRLGPRSEKQSIKVE